MSIRMHLTKICWTEWIFICVTSTNLIGNPFWATLYIHLNVCILFFKYLQVNVSVYRSFSRSEIFHITNYCWRFALIKREKLLYIFSSSASSDGQGLQTDKEHFLTYVDEWTSQRCLLHWTLPDEHWLLCMNLEIESYNCKSVLVSGLP